MFTVCLGPGPDAFEIEIPLVPTIYQGLRLGEVNQLAQGYVTCISSQSSNPGLHLVLQSLQMIILMSSTLLKSTLTLHVDMFLDLWSRLSISNY